MTQRFAAYAILQSRGSENARYLMPDASGRRVMPNPRSAPDVFREVTTAHLQARPGSLEYALLDVGNPNADEMDLENAPLRSQFAVAAYQLTAFDPEAPDYEQQVADLAALRRGDGNRSIPSGFFGDAPHIGAMPVSRMSERDLARALPRLANVNPEMMAAAQESMIGLANAGYRDLVLEALLDASRINGNSTLAIETMSVILSQTERAITTPALERAERRILEAARHGEPHVRFAAAEAMFDFASRIATDDVSSSSWEGRAPWLALLESGDPELVDVVMQGLSERARGFPLAVQAQMRDELRAGLTNPAHSEHHPILRRALIPFADQWDERDLEALNREGSLDFAKLVETLSPQLSPVLREQLAEVFEQQLLNASPGTQRADTALYALRALTPDSGSSPATWDARLDSMVAWGREQGALSALAPHLLSAIANTSSEERRAKLIASFAEATPGVSERDRFALVAYATSASVSLDWSALDAPALDVIRHAALPPSLGEVFRMAGVAGDDTEMARLVEESRALGYSDDTVHLALSNATVLNALPPAVREAFTGSEEPIALDRLVGRFANGVFSTDATRDEDSVDFVLQRDLTESLMEFREGLRQERWQLQAANLGMTNAFRSQLVRTAEHATEGPSFLERAWADVVQISGSTLDFAPGVLPARTVGQLVGSPTPSLSEVFYRDTEEAGFRRDQAEHVSLVEVLESRMADTHSLLADVDATLSGLDRALDVHYWGALRERGALNEADGLALSMLGQPGALPDGVEAD
ncbi:MAG: hypothetical protein AAF658_09225, partial [Myxococcota bacterium]